MIMCRVSFRSFVEGGAKSILSHAEYKAEGNSWAKIKQNIRFGQRARALYVDI